MRREAAPKTFRIPAIACRADEIGAELYEMPDGNQVMAYNRKDAEDWYQTAKPQNKPQPIENDPLL